MHDDDFEDELDVFDEREKLRAAMLNHEATLTRAWVLHPDLVSNRHRRDPKHALAEAVSLARALPHLDVIGSEPVRLPKMVAGVLFGSGKIAELKARFKEEKIDLVLVDGKVSPVQQRNLEKEWGVKLLDRTGLILEIFADRARTREGVLQVELAALSYQRTRLVRAWTHLERQRGGLGFVGGPGETQIESDRRAIDDAIVRIKRALARVIKTRRLHRDSRAKIPYPVVALVGYTNAGKSTLFNRLTGADVFVKDMLFATLDPTMRSVTLPSGRQIIMSDTVGFISNLPHQLVAAFRATLEEVLDADLIVHVRDIAHPQTDLQSEDVAAILTDLGVSADAKAFEVWNKVDLLAEEDQAARHEAAESSETKFAISATNGDGLERLLAAISDVFEEEKLERSFVLPYADGKKRAWLYDQGVVTAEDMIQEGFSLTVLWTPRQEKNFREM